MLVPRTLYKDYSHRPALSWAILPIPALMCREGLPPTHQEPPPRLASSSFLSCVGGRCATKGPASQGHRGLQSAHQSSSTLEPRSLVRGSRLIQVCSNLATKTMRKGRNDPRNHPRKQDWEVASRRKYQDVSH